MGRYLAQIGDVLMNTHSGRVFKVTVVDGINKKYILEDNTELGFDELDDIYWSNLTYLEKQPPIENKEVVL